MSISIGQATTAGSAVALCTVPPGAAVAILSAASGNGGDALIGIRGAGGSVTTTNTIPLPAGSSWTVAGYNGSAGAQLQVTSAGTATSVTVGFLISNAAGGTGP